ncbi:hypothetical protein CEW87_14050 [Parazoarcus communis]|uniref:XACb0070 ribbon-helix-helix domain-containing protein n=1 Tax=Parazoarcus communis TaxID=41977 RepID=A0A2U8H359_9RHOO|nr:hypothetical protein CEW87_14050 [Parazoarcus communis]
MFLAGKGGGRKGDLSRLVHDVVRAATWAAPAC